MVPGIIVITIASILAVGHIWWGKQVPLKNLAELGNPIPVLASYHACWYHISIIFGFTAVASAAHLLTSWANSELLWALWIIIFGCWLTYLGVVYRYPSMRRLGWGQITLIFVLLIALGIQADSLEPLR